MKMSNGARRHSRLLPGLTACVLASTLAAGARQGTAGQGRQGLWQTAGAGGAQGRGGQQTPPTQGQAAGQGRAGGQAAGQGQGPQPARDNLAQPVGTGSINGAVVLSGAGTPVRRARVNLNGAELRGGRSTTTDDQGRFSFVSLPAGRFTMNASKPGYVNIAYGAKKPGRAGTPIQLAEGQKLEKATINMPKGSVVTGVVIDENGEPSPQTQVRVMRFVTQTGEKTLQQAGTDQTDDRGVYRIYGLQPGDYIVSATPRNANLNDLTQTVMAQVESLVQQAQAAGAGGGGGGGAGLGAAVGGPGGLANLLGGRGGGRGQQFLDQASQLQQQLQQQSDQTVGYAPVYFPGTTISGSAAAITLSVGEERPGIDFQLQLVPTARVEGSIVSPDGTLPPGTQIMLAPAGQTNMPPIPGVSTNTTRVDQTGKFSFSNVTPGQYTLMARAAIRDTSADAAGGQRQGRGGPGGRGGAITQVLWASTDIAVSGQNLTDVQLHLQPGMTVSGRVVFDASTLTPPTDLTRIRVTLTPVGQQPLDIGGAVPPADVDASGNFKITGVAPGRYALRGNVMQGGGQNAAGVGAAGGGGRGAGGGGRAGGAAATGAPGTGGAAGTPGAAAGNWSLKSAVVGGRDTLDFPIEIRPNEDAAGAVITFIDRTQELSGTLQDASGRPTSDFTIVVFPTDNRYWLPQSRRIASARPGTDGKFTIRSLPAGDYRLTAVTDAEPGEWYDPAFLSQIVSASLPIAIGVGEKKTQDLKLAGGGS